MKPPSGWFIVAQNNSTQFRRLHQCPLLHQLSELMSEGQAKYLENARKTISSHTGSLVLSVSEGGCAAEEHVHGSVSDPAAQRH
jgi:hypothetical protein